MKKLLIVANMPSANTTTLAEAVLAGANHQDISNVETTLLAALDAGPREVLDADGIIIGTTENFGSMSGLIKDFLERIYYPCLEEKQGLSCALYIRAGNDGTGTRLGIEKILTGLAWKSVNPPLMLKGEYQASFESDCKELGMLVAAGLDAGIF